MKRNTTRLIAALTLSLGVMATGAYGQRGAGEETGVARQAVNPEVVSLTGTVLEVKTEPCKLTTGPADKGTHFLLQTSAGEQLDIHLGPEVKVHHVAKKLTVDQMTTVKAFRTQRLPENAYIAQSVTVDEETIRLRDDDLRPVWAGGMAMQKGRGRWSAGFGPGGGRGPGWAAGGQGNRPCQDCCVACLAGAGPGARCAARGTGNGRGNGRDAAAGPGVGKGPGNGMGRGLGNGMGRGPGKGRGKGRGNGPGPGARFSDT